MDVLVAGNTGYLTKDALLKAFPQDSVVVLGKDIVGSKEGHIKWFNESILSEKFDRLFMTYGFEKVVFFSKYLTREHQDKGELEELKKVLYMSNHVNIKQFVYITSDETLLDEENSTSIIYRSAEELCRYYCVNNSIDFKILSIPYLISGNYKDDFWCRVFASLEKKEEVVIRNSEEEIADYLDINDLADFLLRLFDSWDENQAKATVENIYLRSGGSTDYKTVRNLLLKHYPGADIKFVEKALSASKVYGPDKARNEYGWFAKMDAAAEIESYLESYRKKYYKRPSFQEWLSKKIKLNSRFMMFAELIGGTILVELYNIYASGSVQFRMIDIRLVFVVLMATVYGTSIGMITSFLMIASLVFAYYRQGSNALLIFYDPGNWIPFILLMVTAAVCGYVKQKNDEDVGFVKEENETISEENRFVSSLYNEAMEYKNIYKQDLIGSRDGFARIFEVVQRLSTTVPEEIFAQSIPVMEDVLNNKSIAIYTINDKSARFARLNVASESISSKLRKSINLDEYRKVFETLQKNEVWFNTDVEEGFPSYIAGIKSDNTITVLIMIYHVEYAQIGTYYTNLIRILAGLMENFILKAWDYQKAVAARIYIEGTNLVKSDYFRQQLDIQKEMMKNKLTSFRLFKIEREGRTLIEIDDMFRTKTRNNDIIGIGDDDNIYILASGVDEASENIILSRFNAMGLTCEIVGDMA